MGMQFACVTAPQIASGSPAFTPNSGYSIVYTSLADGAIIDLYAPATLSTKPNGVAPLFLNRFGAGYQPSGGTVDPYSRTAGWTDVNFPTTGMTTAMQSSTVCPGSAHAFQMNLPGAAVITGTLTNGSGVITNVTQVSGTAFASIDYGYGGLVAKDFTSVNPAIYNGYASSNLIPDNTTCNSTQSNLGSNQITLNFTYSGTTTNNVTIYIAYGPDQVAGPRPAMPNVQDQIVYWRGMNSFPFRTVNLGYQNNKFIRGFTSGLTTDAWLENDGSGTAANNRIFIDSTSLGSSGDIYLTSPYVWTANQWFTQSYFYHGNTSSGSADGGIIYVADNTTRLGTPGTSPSSQGLSFWGGSSTNPVTWELNDFACRCLSPLAGDTMWLDRIYQDDSSFCILIGTQELQIPYQTWGASHLRFVIQRSFLDALNGGAPGSLTGLPLVIQTNYAQQIAGYFTAAA